MSGRQSIPRFLFCQLRLGSFGKKAAPRFFSSMLTAGRCAVRFLDLIKPFTPLLPEVASPETKIPFNQKLMWTGVKSSSPRCNLKILIRPLYTDMYHVAHTPHFLGYEPNAVIRHCIFRLVGSIILAAHDAS